MNPRTLSYCLTAFLCVLMLSSCQKAYERPDITLGSNPGGGGSTTGKYLTRAEAKTTGNTTEGTVITYQYDANNRLTNLLQQHTDSSNQVYPIGYFYKRDAAGRVVRVSQNLYTGAPAGTPGIPDSIFVSVHYPSASSTEFDYTVSTMNFMGIDYLDSTIFTYSNGAIIKKTVYSGTSLSPIAPTGFAEYRYANGNLVEMKEYLPGSILPAVILTISFDEKRTCMDNGIEAFLPGRGEGTLSKNNATRQLYTDNTNGKPMVDVTFSYQYNSDNMPVTGTSQQTVPMVKTQTLKFFYK